MYLFDLSALPEHDNSLESVRDAFRACPSVNLTQGWREQPESLFRPGRVRAGRRGESVCVFAEFEDEDVFTRARRLNEKMWELGDTFEIFLRPADQDAYVELHVTPNNQRLQLRFASVAAFQRVRDTGDLSPHFIEEEVFRSLAWVRADEQRWFAYAEIPAASVNDSPRPLDGQEWLYSFSRYDYTRGRTDPILSSSSPHPRLDFHSQAEWRRMKF